jgi:hypothetical protein
MLMSNPVLFRGKKALLCAYCTNIIIFIIFLRAKQLIQSIQLLQTQHLQQYPSGSHFHEIGRAAGVITVAVMTGARASKGHALLAQSNPDFTKEEMTKLPDLLEHLDSLATIQQMKFKEQTRLH